jgi:hypothetical protein
MNCKKIIFVASFLAVSGFLFSFNTPSAKAITAVELQTLIAQLQQQITQLQQQLLQLQGTPVAWCHDFNTNLRYGDGGDGNSYSGIGAEVYALIQVLSKEGLIDYNQVVQPGAAGTSIRSSYFSETIASAVVAFQEKYASEVLSSWGLTHGTGVVGPTTRAKLNKLYGCGAITPPVVTPPTTTTPITTPSITALSPNYGYIGDTINLVITGNNFTGAGLYSSWCGLDSTAFQGLEAKGCGVISDSQMYAKFVIGNLAIPGIRYINVRTVNGGPSNSVAFEVRRGIVAPFVTVLSPNGGEKLTAGQTYNIAWTSVGIDKVTLYACYYSNYIGYTCDKLSAIPDAGIDASLGKYSWRVDPNAPYIPGSLKIRVSSVKLSNGLGDLDIYDESNNYFNIVVATTTPSITVISPNGGESLQEGSNYKISWNASNLPSDAKIYITLFRTGGANIPIALNLPVAQREYNWKVTSSGDWALGYESKPSFLAKLFGITEVEAAGYSYQVMVSASWGTYGTNYYGNIYDNGDGWFYINPPTQASITVLSPNGGEAWAIGSAQTIKWNPVSGYSYALVDLVRGANNAYVKSISVGNSMTSGQFTWQVPSDVPAGNDYKIYINASNAVSTYGTISDLSDNYFSIY